MHEPFFVVDAFLQGNHGFSPVNAFNVVDHENHVFSVLGVFSPDFTEDIEFARCNVRNGYKWNFIDAFQNEFGLGGIVQKYAYVSDKGITKFLIIKR